MTISILNSVCELQVVCYFMSSSFFFLFLGMSALLRAGREEREGGREREREERERERGEGGRDGVREGDRGERERGLEREGRAARGSSCSR